MSAYRVRRWGIGVGLAGGAIVAAVMIGPGAAHADAPDDLLNSAIANLTDTNNVLSQLPSGSDDLGSIINADTQLDDTMLHFLDQLKPAEDTISAHAGSLSSLVDQAYFVPLDQQWDQSTEALLQADQALAAAISSGSGVEAAEAGAWGPEFQLLGDFFNSFPVVIAGDFFGADFTP